MKRDMDLIRDLLRWAQDAKVNAECWSTDFNKGYDHLVVAEHIRLLKEADLVGAYLVEADGDILKARIDRLTWEGQNFIDNAASDTVWNKAKAMAKEKGLSLTVELLKTLLPYAATMVLGLPAKV